MVLCLSAAARGDDSVWKSPDADAPTAALISEPANFAPSGNSSLAALNPKLFDDTSDDNTVYGPPPVSPQQVPGNNGNVEFDLSALYATDYVYRGVDHDDVSPSGNSLNLLIDGRLTFRFWAISASLRGCFCQRL